MRVTEREKKYFNRVAWRASWGGNIWAEILKSRRNEPYEAPRNEKKASVAKVWGKGAENDREYGQEIKNHIT